MHARTVYVLLAICVLGCAPETAAQGRWTALRTANFLFIGDARENQIRQTAEILEQFREVLSVALPRANNRSPVPTVVIVFASERSIAPYRPQFQGRAIDVGGYFQPGEDVNYIAINAAHEASAIRAILHEYSHFVTRNTAGVLPVWVSEGVAQFYETFALQNRGRSALIGRAPGEHLELLRTTQLMPVAELIAIDHASPVYNEGRRRGLFYAQSWALWHYLTLGNQARAPQLHDFLARVSAGAPADQALEHAFGVPPSTLERELREYVRGLTFTAIRFTFDQRVATAIPQRGERMADAEAQAYLGDLLARLNRGDDARAHLGRLLQGDQPNARAASALGLLELREDRIDEAMPLLQRAADLRPDDGGIQAALGRGLIEQLQQERGDRLRHEALLEQARTVLSRAADLEPELAHVRAMLGYVEATAGTDMARAIALLEDAVQLSPGREQYRLMLADALIREREYDRARQHLGPLVARSSQSHVRENARTMLARVATLYAAEESGRAAPEVIRDLPVFPPERAALPPDPPGLPLDQPGASAERPRRPSYILDLRQVQNGERRVLGAFERIDCAAGRIVLRVATAIGAVLLSARQLSEVEFVSYLSQPPGSVSCGPIPDTPRVLATFRPRFDEQSPEINGEAVAIELIPADYEPP